MDYYYTDGTNQPRGPVTLAELHELAASGAINASTLVAAVGSDHWSPLGAIIPALAPVATAPTEPLAIWSFVLGLLGLMCCAFFAGVPAVICGHMALSNINKKTFVQGKGLAIAGLVIGYITIAFWALYLLLFGGIAIFQGFAEHGK